MLLPASNWKAYGRALWSHWVWSVTGVAGLVAGLFRSVEAAVSGAATSDWVWWLVIAVLGLMTAQYLAWRDAFLQRGIPGRPYQAPGIRYISSQPYSSRPIGGSVTQFELTAPIVGRTLSVTFDKPCPASRCLVVLKEGGIESSLDDKVIANKNLYTITAIMPANCTQLTVEVSTPDVLEITRIEFADSDEHLTRLLRFSKWRLKQSRQRRLKG